MVEVVSNETATELLLISLTSMVIQFFVVNNLLNYVTYRNDMKREIFLDISDQKRSKAFIFTLLKCLLQTLNWMQICAWISMNTNQY